MATGQEPGEVHAMESNKTCWNCQAGQYNLPTQCLICLNKESKNFMKPVKMDGCCDRWKFDSSAPEVPHA